MMNDSNYTAKLRLKPTSN